MAQDCHELAESHRLPTPSSWRSERKVSVITAFVHLLCWAFSHACVVPPLCRPHRSKIECNGKNNVEKEYRAALRMRASSESTGECSRGQAAPFKGLQYLTTPSRRRLGSGKG
jgi:hypothetical protein